MGPIMSKRFAYAIDRRYLPLLVPFGRRRRLELWDEPRRGGVHPFRGEGAIAASPKWPLGAHRDRGGPGRVDQRLGGRSRRSIRCLLALSRAGRRPGASFAE